MILTGINSKLYEIYCNFPKDEQLICVDSQHLQGAFTYIRDDGQCVSWIDHLVCSPALMSCVSDVSVLYDIVSSDHRPLSVCFDSVISSGYTAPCSNTGMVKGPIINLSKASTDHLNGYVCALRAGIKSVDIPCHILTCKGVCCDSSHYNLI